MNKRLNLHLLTLQILVNHNLDICIQIYGIWRICLLWICLQVILNTINYLNLAVQYSERNTKKYYITYLNLKADINPHTDISCIWTLFFIRFGGVCGQFCCRSMLDELLPWHPCGGWFLGGGGGSGMEGLVRSVDSYSGGQISRPGRFPEDVLRVPEGGEHLNSCSGKSTMVDTEGFIDSDKACLNSSIELELILFASRPPGWTSSFLFFGFLFFSRERVSRWRQIRAIMRMLRRSRSNPTEMVTMNAVA